LFDKSGDKLPASIASKGETFKKAVEAGERRNTAELAVSLFVFPRFLWEESWT
jgi:hypothetical protein